MPADTPENFDDETLKVPARPADGGVQRLRSDTANDALVGTTLDGGKILIERRLGAGGAGTVYLALDRAFEQKVAIKFLQDLDEKKLKRFQLEAIATRSLAHPNVLRIFNFGIENNRAFIVMEFLDGQPFSNIMRNEFPLETDRILCFIRQVCFALAHAHERNVVHRDIKPANMVIVKKPDGTEHLIVVDFGIAKIMESDNTLKGLTTTGRIFGSPVYMSPEQSKGNAVDGRSDIYSLGCVLYECLAGTPPHMGKSPIETLIMHQNETPLSLQEASMGRSFSPALEKLVFKMLAKDPAERYQTIEEVLNDIDSLDLSSPSGKFPNTKEPEAEPVVVGDKDVGNRQSRSIEELAVVASKTRKGGIGTVVVLSVICIALIALAVMFLTAR